MFGSRFVVFAPMLAVGVGLLVSAGPGAAEPEPRPAAAGPLGWKLAWSDEFDGKEIDRTKWDFDLGNGFYDYAAEQWVGGWGNGELQYYTREPENAFVKDGMLHLRALKESRDGCGYTSAKLKTKKRDGTTLFARTYGRFEFRAKLPTGQGVWPALWMLPAEDKYGTWASSGEIDVLEVRGHQPTKILGTIHFGGKWPVNAESSTTYDLPDKGTVADFHVYAVEWEPGEIRWSVDGKTFATKSFWWSSAKTDGGRGAAPTRAEDLNPWPAPFDRPFYLLMNVAVGGKFPGKPEKATPFPAELVVDYVRVYEKVGGYGNVKPRGGGKLPFEK
jgi:beta-glucanase (GH16 family)